MNINKMKGFRLNIELTDTEARRYGINLEGLAKLASGAILKQVPTAKIALEALTQNPQTQSTMVWNTRSSVLIINGLQVPLTKYEEILMELLIDNLNQYVAYPTINMAIHGKYGDAIAPAHLRVTVNRLRNKMGIHRDMLTTSRAHGYALREGDSQLTII